MIEDLAARIRQFIDDEMRSCSMDIGGITPLYIYRMWGGSVAIDDIAAAMEEISSLTDRTDYTDFDFASKI